jgi:hypothetical protein
MKTGTGDFTNQSTFTVPLEDHENFRVPDDTDLIQMLRVFKKEQGSSTAMAYMLDRIVARLLDTNRKLVEHHHHIIEEP